jgi:hypothetical protein
LGTGLGTSKKDKSGAVPSEATPDKRDIVFDFISHNPKVVGSNPTPATTFLESKAGPQTSGLFLFCAIVHRSCCFHCVYSQKKTPPLAPKEWGTRVFVQRDSRRARAASGVLI